VIGGLAVVLLAAAGVAAFVLGARGSPHQNGLDAMNSLRRIGAAEQRYREGHPSFGTLAQLADAGLLADEPELATGTRHGYRFVCAPSAEMPDYLWVAVASPVAPAEGAPHWGMDQSGLLLISNNAPFEAGPKGMMKPADAAQPGPPWVTTAPPQPR
jgi:hypothetical protein